MRIDETCRVFVAGAGGMLGDAVHRAFADRSTLAAVDINRTEPWVAAGDVRDYDSIKQTLVDFQPNLIINLAALTDMEQCENDPDNAWLTNAIGAENLGLLANELNATLVYISTAGIFDGAKDVYHDFDVPHPLSVYAQSKFAGETFVREHVRRYFVVRAGWMMGGGPTKDKKFVNKIYKQITAGAKVLRVVDDKLGTPTYTHDFAAGLVRLTESDLYGVYNQACDGACSRLDVATEFVRLLGLENDIGVEPVTSDFFRKDYYAPRPASEQLNNMKLRARGMNAMRDWRTALREYARQFPVPQHLRKPSS